MLQNKQNRVFCPQDKNNNNIVHTVTTHIKTATTTAGKYNEKKDAPQSKSAKVRNIKTKHGHQDDDKGAESAIGAKRTKVVDDAGSITSSKSIELNVQRDCQPSTSAPASLSPSNVSSDDDVIVILDSSIDSNVLDSSMDESSLANTTASTSKSASSASSSRRDRSYRAANYNFDALQTDDETDEEDNISYAPHWSKFKNRNGPAIDQEEMNSSVIDKFFGSHAETVDLKAIFPRSQPIARRRSTAVWTTPTRYSSLPKY